MQALPVKLLPKIFNCICHFQDQLLKSSLFFSGLIFKSHPHWPQLSLRLIPEAMIIVITWYTGVWVMSLHLGMGSVLPKLMYWNEDGMFPLKQSWVKVLESGAHTGCKTKVDATGDFSLACIWLATFLWWKIGKAGLPSLSLTPGPLTKNY